MKKIIESNIIGYELSNLGKEYTLSINPTNNEKLSEKFSNATLDEINYAIKKSKDAFYFFKEVPSKERAYFIETIANNIMDLGDTLIHRVQKETGLTEQRIVGERGRTVSQLKLFAELIKDGSWVDASIDLAEISRTPIPKPDLRKKLHPLGPVAVFAASNFPLAYSTAGGDAACALAAGNTLIVKAHSAHPGTSALIGEAIMEASKKCEMPDGVFSLLHGSGSFVGQHLIKHPDIKAGGFTGSEKAGMILHKIATDRDEPIPFFAEMGSINPVLLFDSALNNQTIDLLVASITLGVGQFCTNPGLIICQQNEKLDDFIQKLSSKIKNTKPATMLNPNICLSYNKSIKNMFDESLITMEGTLGQTDDANNGMSMIGYIDGHIFLKNNHLKNEVFGPFSLIVKCKDLEEINKVILAIKGQLTGSIFASEIELKKISKTIDLMKSKVGRIIYNGVPTGVEVCTSMHHGGPFPASSDSRFSAVGSDAIKRFVRPISYQSFPQEMLPDELKDDNPLNILRNVNGTLTKNKI